jgi:hypothetical protein
LNVARTKERSDGSASCSIIPLQKGKRGSLILKLPLFAYLGFQAYPTSSLAEPSMSYINSLMPVHEIIREQF